jgi:hypothetical protein
MEMKEAEVRKFHRNLGIIMVWFLAGQTLTGLVLSLGGMTPAGSPTGLYNLLSTLHFGWNPLGGIYRTLLALAVFAQGISGIIIYYLIRTRSSKV